MIFTEPILQQYVPTIPQFLGLCFIDSSIFNTLQIIHNENAINKVVIEFLSDNLHRKEVKLESGIVFWKWMKRFIFSDNVMLSALNSSESLMSEYEYEDACKLKRS